MLPPPFSNGVACVLDFSGLGPGVLYITQEVLSQTVSFHLNSLRVPACIQSVVQIRQGLRMGTVKVGDKLPTVKEVVAEVAINRIARIA